MSWSPPAPGGGGAVSSVTDAGAGTLAISPTTGAVLAEMASGVVTPGSFGTRFVVPRITVDTYGRVTALTNNAQILLNSIPYSLDILTSVIGAVTLAFGNLYVVQSMSGTATATLPAANSAGSGANWLTFSRQDQSSDQLLLVANGSDTIGESSAALVVVPGESMTLVADGTSNWIQV